MNIKKPRIKPNQNKKKNKQNTLNLETASNVKKEQEINMDTESPPNERDKKLIALKTYLNEANTPLNYVEFISLIENLKGCKNPVNIISNYTTNFKAFSEFISKDIYPNVRNSSIKRKCTQILKSLNYNTDQFTPAEKPHITPIMNC